MEALDLGTFVAGDVRGRAVGEGQGAGEAGVEQAAAVAAGAAPQQLEELGLVLPQPGQEACCCPLKPGQALWGRSADELVRRAVAQRAMRVNLVVVGEPDRELA